MTLATAYNEVTISPKWLGRSAPILTAALLTGIFGCLSPRLPPVSDNVPMSVAISRVNDNTRKMNFLLRAGGVSATGRIARTSGKTESFDAAGTLFFRSPRNLYMELKHALAGKMEIGSNDSEFWYWEQFDIPRYCTGRYDQMSAATDTDVPLRPDQLVDMLGLRELSTGSAGGSGSLFKVGQEDYFLDVFERDAAEDPFRAKTIAISRRPPYLVSAITYYTGDGRPWMRASILNYRPIVGTDVMVPRKIKVQSLVDKGWLNLEFGNMKPWNNPTVEQQRIVRSPLQRGEKVGEIIRMDRPSAAWSSRQAIR